MVHALEVIRRLLKPDGVLIDLRPKGRPAEFKGWRNGTSKLLGYLQETDDYIEYRHAAWAVEQAMDNKWFGLQANGGYEFIVHADSLGEIKAYLDIEWTDGLIPSQVRERSEEMGAEKITLHDFIHIGILRSIK